MYNTGVTRKRQYQLTIFLDDTELALLEQVAARNGLDKSNQVRQLIRDAAKQPTKAKTRQR